MERFQWANSYEIKANSFHIYQIIIILIPEVVQETWKEKF